MSVVQCKVLVVGCAGRLGAEVCAHLASHGMTAVAVGYDELASTVEVFTPDLAVATVAQGDVAVTIAWVRGGGDLPILMLVPAGSDPSVRIAAFRLGADDVVVEPADIEELAVRVWAILRRRNVGDQIRVSDLVIDEAGYTARRGDHLLSLTPTEFHILDLLARNVGVVITKRQMLAEVWGFDDFDVNVVEVHVSALRRKLELHGPRIVQTVRGIGYVLRDVAPTSEIRLAASA